MVVDIEEGGIVGCRDLLPHGKELPPQPTDPTCLDVIGGNGQRKRSYLLWQNCRPSVTYFRRCGPGHVLSGEHLTDRVHV